MTSRFSALTLLLNPKSVAIIGASADPTRIGGRPIDYMLKQRFQGPIYPVNPNRPEIQGLRAYPAIADLPESPDTAIVAVPGPLAIQAIEDLGARGTRTAIVFTAGFAEMDAPGAEAQTRLMAAAKRHDMRIIGPNSLGLFNANTGFYATFSSSLESGWPNPAPPGSGTIGIASQSGAYGTHMFAIARNRRLATPICVTTGNEADVTIGDIIGWLAEDPATAVIAAYAEGIHNAPGLLEALEIARQNRKPVIMMKVGTSAIGAHAAQSHTASIAGNDAVTSAVLQEFGVIRARTTEQMLDIAATATRRIYPAANTLGVITISGGAGVLISDAAETVNLALPPMPEAAQARLKTLLPFAAPRNPVDCTAQAFNDIALVGQFMESMVQDGNYTSILAFFTQVGGSPTIAPRLREQLAAIRARHPDRLYVLNVVASEAQNRDYEADGYTVFEDPTRAVVAIEAMGRLGAAFARPPAPPLPPHPNPVHLPPTTPTEAEAKHLLRAAGIESPPETVCTTPEQAVAAAAAIPGPVVMKIVSPDIPHKSEIGGVILNITGPGAVSDAFATLTTRARTAAPHARLDGILVARQLSGGVECILGIQQDPVFGPIAMFGLGGIFVEIAPDIRLHRCPITPQIAETMIRSIRAAPILQGARGRPPVDIPALATMLSRLSIFAQAAGPRLRSIDLNPVLALPEGAYALDAAIELSPC